MFKITSTFSFTGDASATLNTLTKTTPTTLTLADLSGLNYSEPELVNNSAPNANNQLIFMNQPMGWWIEQLQNGSVEYFPLSNYVNWAYTDVNKVVYHIGRPISDLLIPNTVGISTRDPVSNTITTVFGPKFGMGRTDIQKMN